jgi:hypothetical protein
MRWWEEGRIATHVSRCWPLERAGESHQGNGGSAGDRQAGRDSGRACRGRRVSRGSDLTVTSDLVILLEPATRVTFSGNLSLMAYSVKTPWMERNRRAAVLGQDR